MEKSETTLDSVNEAIEQVLDGSAPAPRTVFRMVPSPASAVSADHEMVEA